MSKFGQYFPKAVNYLSALRSPSKAAAAESVVIVSAAAESAEKFAALDTKKWPMESMEIGAAYDRKAPGTSVKSTSHLQVLSSGLNPESGKGLE
jgi:hypothetical protein